MSTKKKASKAAEVSAGDRKVKGPTLVELVATAGRFYGRALQGIQGFAETYVLADSLYGREARTEFKAKFPLYTDSMWSHLAKVGKKELLPHFLLCSDSMIAGILRLKDSMEKQLNLVGALKGGKIETVSATGKITMKSLDELSKLDELGIVFAMSSATSPEEIRKFAYAYRAEWRKSDGKAARPDFEKIGDFLRVNHAIKSLSKKDWSAMGVMMGWI